MIFHSVQKGNLLGGNEESCVTNTLKKGGYHSYMINAQTGNGDFTLLHNGKIYRFPTESERWEFLCEEAQEKSDTLVIDFKPGKERQK